MSRTGATRCSQLPFAVLALVSLLTASCGTVEGRSMEPPGPVAFEDGFDNANLGDVWATCYWWDDGGCTNLSNDETQWYQPGAVSIEDGALRLTATPESSQHLGRQFTYQSGMVTTGRIGDPNEQDVRLGFTYGHVEVRFRTPTGAGLWPAIWMLPVTNESLPEIDLLEQYGDDTERASFTLHTATHDEPRVDRRTVAGPDLAKGWHTVALDWSEGILRWNLDGRETFRVTGSRVPSEPMYLLMNLAVGGTAGDTTKATVFPATFLVDQIIVRESR